MADRPDEGVFEDGSVRELTLPNSGWPRHGRTTSGHKSRVVTFRAVLSFLITVMCVIVAQADESTRQDAQPVSAELHTRCLEILFTGLESVEFWPAMHAAEAMTLAHARDEVISALRARVAEEKDDQHRCGLARELFRAGELKHAETLFQILGDVKSTGRTHAAESLYKIGEIGDGKLLQAAMRQTEIIPLQIMAAGALAKSGDAKAFSMLREQVHSKETTTRNLSAWILGRVGDESDVEPLLAALKSEKDDTARGYLAAALACLGNEQGRSELGLQLSSENVTARTMAAEFVGHSRSIEFREKLIQLLDDPALDVRVRSAQSLIALSMPGTRR